MECKENHFNEVYWAIAEKLNDLAKEKGIDYAKKKLADFAVENKFGPVEDKSKKDKKKDVKLDEMDPFTFFAFFNNGRTDINRDDILKKVLEILEIDISYDRNKIFEGIPTANNQSLWYFPYKYERNEDDIKKLWKLFRLMMENEKDNEEFENLFNDCLKIKTIAFKKLTMGLYWIKPDVFISLDKYTLGYLEKHFNINTKDLEKDFDFKKYKTLLDKLKGENFFEIVCKARNEKKKKEKKINIQEENNSSKGKTISQPLNQILYGPPGTGKTYETIKLAVEIIDNCSYDGVDRKKVRERFNELKKQGQIEFVTFHQSFSYEDFVEGIKPDLDGDGIKYKIEDGVFKQISNKAKENFENSQQDTFIDFTDLIEDFAYYVDENKPVSLREGRSGDVLLKEVSFNEEGDFNSFTLGGSVKSNQRLTKKIVERDIKDFFEGLIKSENDVKPTFESKNKRHGNALYYFSLYEKIKKFFEKNKNKYLKNKEPLKNYVLIIDEINRGNIAKIFGELITLIEEDKRVGKEEELTVTLPYSKNMGKKFGVPCNLYIIGTMNTADRSLVYIDSALRRRFVFKKFYPKPELLKNKIVAGIDLSEFLEGINKKIVELYDKDHQIGHSYFFNIESKEDLEDVLQNRIIPLLEEYFFDDKEKIKEIFGVYKISVNEIVDKFRKNDDNKDI